jgi:hypothetical protein
MDARASLYVALFLGMIWRIVLNILQLQGYAAEAMAVIQIVLDEREGLCMWLCFWEWFDGQRIGSTGTSEHAEKERGKEAHPHNWFLCTEFQHKLTCWYVNSFTYWKWRVSLLWCDHQELWTSSIGPQSCCERSRPILQTILSRLLYQLIIFETGFKGCSFCIQ